MSFKHMKFSLLFIAGSLLFFTSCGDDDDMEAETFEATFTIGANTFSTDAYVASCITDSTEQYVISNRKDKLLSTQAFLPTLFNDGDFLISIYVSPTGEVSELLGIKLSEEVAGQTVEDLVFHSSSSFNYTVNGTTSLSGNISGMLDEIYQPNDFENLSFSMSIKAEYDTTIDVCQ